MVGSCPRRTVDVKLKQYRPRDEIMSDARSLSKNRCPGSSASIRRHTSQPFLTWSFMCVLVILSARVAFFFFLTGAAATGLVGSATELELSSSTRVISYSTAQLWVVVLVRTASK